MGKSPHAGKRHHQDKHGLHKKKAGKKQIKAENHLKLIKSKKKKSEYQLQIEENITKKTA